MKATILLNYSENTQQVEEEEKSRFLRGILEQCFDGTDAVNKFREIWTDEGPLAPSKKVKLRELLAIYKLQVIDNLDGHMKIYLENELIAEWLKCNYKLKRDLNVVDPKQRIFLEMEVNCWSVFDPPENIEET